MPGKPKPLIKKKRKHLPQIEIDWDEVDKKLVGGSNGVQIASSMGFSLDTLYDRVKTEKGLTFSNYAAKKRAKGDLNLHMIQYAKAMQGNVTMLIWLGKQRLGQKEHPDANIEFSGKCAEFLDFLKNASSLLMPQKDTINVEPHENEK